MNTAKIIQESDFNSSAGQYVLPNDCFQTIQPYLDKYEQIYLTQLLGAELYDLLYSDITTPFQEPDTQRFKDIYNPFSIDDSNCVRFSEGMKSMIQQFVYFEIVRNLSVQKTSTGVVFNNNENAKGPVYKGFNIIEAFNEGVRNAKEIQWFICDQPTVYPEENTQVFYYTNGI